MRDALIQHEAGESSSVLPEASTESPKRFYNEAYQRPGYAEAASPEQHPYYPLVAGFVTEYALEGKRCLEIGAGRGAFQDVVDDYVGVDIADSAAQFLHKPFIACDARQLPFADSEFDAAWSITVLEHVPEPERALAEMRRVLRPGGVLLLAPAWHTRSWFAQGYPVRPYSDLTLRGRIIKASIPLVDFAPLRYARVLTRRALRYAVWRLCGHPAPFRYGKLKPNYDRYWMSDSDAVNSLDPFDAILWFISRGDRCRSHPTPFHQLLVRCLALVIQVRK